MTEPEQKPTKILLVENNYQRVRLAFAKHLRELGYEVEAPKGQIPAIEKLNEVGADFAAAVVVFDVHSDIRHPDDSSLGAIRQTRLSQPRIPVVVILSIPSNVEYWGIIKKIRPKEYGGTVDLQSPYTDEQLAAAIRQAMRRRQIFTEKAPELKK